MISYLQIDRLTKSIGDRMLFRDVTLGIYEGDKIGLIAQNGAGKSTFLNVLAGKEDYDSGRIVYRNDLRVGYLEQQPPFDPGQTLLEYATPQRRDAEDFTGPDLARQMLYQFRLTDMDQKMEELSGGQLKRAALVKVLLSEPDFLMLDEPTNHLDIESIQWLEQFMVSKAKAVVLVSHDRAFIDNVTNRTIEISLGHIYDYAVNYSRFVELRKERVEQQMRAYQNQQKQIQDTEDFIERFRYKATKSVQVQSRIKQLAKIERIEVDEVDTSHLNLRFPPAPRSGDFPLIVENVGKAYGDHQVFDHATFTLRRGEKVAFVGKNGEGKSTLVKCIMGEIPFTGSLRLGHNVKIGYFAQNQAQLLDGEITVFDTIDRVAVGDIRLKIRDILGAFMFGGEASDKKVKVLSGGEKTRLAMIRLLLEPVNLLILDEPTNHLDMKTKDILKQAIKDFDGTVIVVSHDREFLDGLVEKVYEFGGGQVRECLGGIYEFLEKKKLASLRELEARTPAEKRVPAAKSPQPRQQAPTPAPTAKLSYAEQRERDKIVRKATKKVEEAENEVARREQALADIEAKIAAGEVAPEIFTAHEQAGKDLENAMSLWELAQTELDDLKSQWGI